MSLALPPQQRSQGQYTQLHVAARNGCAAHTAVVLASGSVDIDDVGPHGSTALMVAAHNGDVQVGRILLKNGANVWMVDDWGFTALLVC